CQAMPQGGTLRLACRPLSRKRVELAVEDTGVGIPPEHIQKIFDLYFTTKEKGSGIGLSMVYRIVQLHDGDVEVQSTPGRGTRFRLVFPQAKPEEINPAAIRGQSAGGRVRVRQCEEQGRAGAEHATGTAARDCAL